jgi:tetratricopeptide (TPR) repeat protein
MRRRLGEQREAIRRSRPLPDVTTGSLTGACCTRRRRGRFASDGRAAAALVDEALQLDSSFAMAHRLAGISASNQLMFGESAAPHRPRLRAEREAHGPRALARGGGFHANLALEPRRAADAYELLLHRYPDDWVANHNLGSLLLSWLDDADGALLRFVKASELAPELVGPLGSAAHAAFAGGDVARADRLAELAAERGFDDFSARWTIGRAFALNDQRTAAAGCDSILAGSARRESALDDLEFCGSVDVAAGRLHQGVSRLEAAERGFLEAGRLRHAAHAAQAIALAHVLRGDTGAAVARIEALIARVPADSIAEPDRFINRTTLQVQAALLGRVELADRIADTYPPYPDPDHWFGRTGEALVARRWQSMKGDGEAAPAALQAELDRGRDAIGLADLERAPPRGAFELLGPADSAAVHYGRASGRPPPPHPPLTKDRIFLPLALRRLAEVQEARGDHQAAADAYGRLLHLWADADIQPEVAAVRAALARLTATGS